MQLEHTAGADPSSGTNGLCRRRDPPSSAPVGLFFGKGKDGFAFPTHEGVGWALLILKPHWSLCPFDMSQSVFIQFNPKYCTYQLPQSPIPISISDDEKTGTETQRVKKKPILLHFYLQESHLKRKPIKISSYPALHLLSCACFFLKQRHPNLFQARSTGLRMGHTKLSQWSTTSTHPQQEETAQRIIAERFLIVTFNLGSLLRFK